MADRNEQTSSAELERQIAALRDDFGAMTALLRDMATERGKATVAGAREAADTLSHEAARRGYQARDAVDTAVRDHPVASLGIAAVLGFVLGALTRR